VPQPDPELTVSQWVLLQLSAVMMVRQMTWLPGLA
jgi:hypothetical protein